MSAITPEEKKRLAGKCEEVAMGLIERTPATLDGNTWCRCGIGHVLQAAGFVPRGAISPPIAPGAAPTISLLDYVELADDLDRLVGGAISDATDMEVAGRRGALVFPLLALRDALLEAP